MFGTGLTMFLAVILLITHIDRKTMRRIVGYALLVDIGVLVLMLNIFGGTGEERLGALAMTLGITAALHAYRWAYGHAKLQRKGARIRWHITKGHFA